MQLQVAIWLLLAGVFASFLKGKIMQSILEILLVTIKSGKSKKTNADYSISEAHCILRNGDGTPGAVGVLVVPKALEDVAKPGLFTASFGLVAAAYGENQGRIVAVLAGLVPVRATALGIKQ